MSDNEAKKEKGEADKNLNGSIALSDDEEFIGKNLDVSGNMTADEQALGSGNTFAEHFNVKGPLFATFHALKNRRWVATIRSPTDFANHKNFAIPYSREEVTERISNNYNHYLTNYVIILILMLAYAILSRPYLLLLLLAIGYFWLVVSKKESIRITETVQIRGNAKYGIFVAAVLSIWVLVAGKIIATLFAIFSTCVLLHMIFYKRKEGPEGGDYSEIEAGTFP